MKERKSEHIQMRGNIIFSDEHCSKECDWLVYGKLNIAIPHGDIGICCAWKWSLELDLRNAEFLRCQACIDKTKEAK